MDLAPSLAALLRIAGIAVLGLIYLFAGYRWIRFTTRLASALLFAAAAAFFSQDITGSWLQFGLVVAAGFAGFLLGNVLYVLIVLLYGAAAGALLVAGPAGGEAAPWLVGAGAVLGALLALLFERPIAVVASSLLGAFLLAGLLQLALEGPLPSPFALGPAGLAAWAALTLLGAAVQARTSRPLPPTP